ncbi:hypothetical protein LCGC14_0245820 [marine sediment metagenome]|uniref:Uncharacterized protein n=1 Tax=marine sediment metagenome TaxID=412755 RepID=A0A0F9WR27_9ZZZZ
MKIYYTIKRNNTKGQWRPLQHRKRQQRKPRTRDLRSTVKHFFYLGTVEGTNNGIGNTEKEFEKAFKLSYHNIGTEVYKYKYSLWSILCDAFVAGVFVGFSKSYLWIEGDPFNHYLDTHNICFI